MAGQYKALVSSDWNGCLAPCGPFDALSFAFPDLKDVFEETVEQYTGNGITLMDAVRRIESCLPRELTSAQMDAYLDNSFEAYRGVAELIEWCKGQGVLFMINTTGLTGYFQRLFARGLLPVAPALSANPLVRFAASETDPSVICDLHETTDKGINTETILKAHDIPPGRTMVIGDSGGDGPHFQWGYRKGALLAGSMAKPSLLGYCRQRGIPIDNYFGIHYGPGEKRDPQRESAFDFMDLRPLISRLLTREQ